MGKSQLLELVEQQDFETFDNRCLELLQAGEINPGELVDPLDALREAGQKERIKTLVPMILEALKLTPENAPGAVEMAKAALAADPDNPQFREFLQEAYRQTYGDLTGFDQIVAASGITAGRPFRNACKVLDFGLTLQVGDFLLNTMDDNALEVAEIDRPNALFTLRRESRATTLPAVELARYYERVDANDFRVLRQLQPERLNELIENDPVALVIGLIHAHGDHIDQEQLRDELVPRYLDAKSWSKWWTKARAKLKRAPHLVMEGRSPVVLTYSRVGRTLEDEVREAFGAGKGPLDWQKVIETYLQDKTAQREPADEALLAELRDSLLAHVRKVRPRRPAEAVSTALVLDQLFEKGVPALDGARGLAVELLREAQDPLKKILGLDDASLWPRGLDALREALPDEYPQHAAALIGKAPASQLDRLAADAVAGGELSSAQKWIERALDEPHKYPELIYWLWKGPQPVDGLHLPSDQLLFEEILDTLLALGRTLNPSAAELRAFRHRMRAALALKSHAKAQRYIQGVDYGRGVTLKSQLERLEGLGDNAKYALIRMLREAHPNLWAKPVAKRIEPWENPDVVFATAAGIDKRTAERDDIVNVQMRENAKRIGEAAALGDLSENSEYKFALEERDLLRARLAEMNAELSIAERIDPYSVPEDHVGIGSRVQLRRVSDGHEETRTFLGPFESDVEHGIFNYRAPVSQQLMGLRVGDHVTLTIDGTDVEFEVIGLENALAP